MTQAMTAGFAPCVMVVVAMRVGTGVNVEDTLQRTSVTLAAVSHDAWAADVCATP
jgi:general stress protein CsbA